MVRSFGAQIFMIIFFIYFSVSISGFMGEREHVQPAGSMHCFQKNSQDSESEITGYKKQFSSENLRL